MRSRDEKNLGPETEDLETEDLEREVPKPEQSDPEETKRRIQEVAEQYAGPLRGWGGDGPGAQNSAK